MAEKDPKFQITITEAKSQVCYEIYGIVIILFGMATLGLLGSRYEELATLTSLPVIFAVLRVVQVARGRGWK